MGIRKTQQQFEDEVYEKYGSEYMVIGNYLSNKKKILIYHQKCGTYFKTNPYNFLNGHACRKCACEHLGNERRKTTEQFQNELNEKFKDEYLVMENYVSAKKKILLKHTKCNKEFRTKPNWILSKDYGICPHCHKGKSKGEIVIEDFLSKHNIPYEAQKKYKELRGVNNCMLSYDFYIKDFNLLVEYQGEFHDGTAHQQTELEFQKQQEHDRRKKQYAKDNGIELFEIWYWDFDKIEDILESHLLNRVA